AWGYGVAADVLGHLVEAIAGQTLDAFLAERITGPLGMPDTGFWVEPGKQGRIAEPQVERSTGKRPPVADRTRRPVRCGGGGAMVSTAADYARFCRFWLAGGVLDGARVVSPKAVA